MLYPVNNIDHLKIIDMKFMESGHSYLEADSMHSTIERTKKHKKFTQFKSSHYFFKQPNKNHGLQCKNQ